MYDEVLTRSAFTVDPDKNSTHAVGHTIPQHNRNTRCREFPDFPKFWNSKGWWDDERWWWSRIFQRRIFKDQNYFGLRFLGRDAADVSCIYIFRGIYFSRYIIFRISKIFQISEIPKIFVSQDIADSRESLRSIPWTSTAATNSRSCLQGDLFNEYA